MAKEYATLTDLLHNNQFNDEFLARVNNLARDFRSRHGLGEIYQLGLIVPDVEKAAEAIESWGLVPFFIAAGSTTSWHENGHDNHYEGKMGIAYYKNLQIELLEAGQGSDIYKNDIDPKGQIRVHHLGFFVEDVDAWARRLIHCGYGLAIRGTIFRGPSKSMFAYMDTTSSAGLMIEGISHRFLGIHMKIPRMFYQTTARIARLLGKRTLRL